MKRFQICILIFSMLFTFTACNKSNPSVNNSQSSSETLEYGVNNAVSAKQEIDKNSSEDSSSETVEPASFHVSFVTGGDTLSGNGIVTVGVRSDGTVIKTPPGTVLGDYSTWSDIVSVSAGYLHVVGLRGDGSVVANGNNDQNQCEVSDWTDIVAVAAGAYHTVGLKSDGTVVTTRASEGSAYAVDGSDVDSWKNMKAVAVGANGCSTVGLCSDGTVISTDPSFDLSQWHDIVSIACVASRVVGLCSDGTVVAYGQNQHGECNVSEWSDIVAVAVGNEHTVGLRSDGTVVATGSNYLGACDVSGWKEIVAIATGLNHTMGLRADGTIVVVGSNVDGVSDVSGWTDIKIPE